MKRIFFSLILLLSTHFVWAESASNALAKQLSQVVIFSSHFKQEVLDEKGVILQQSFGEMQFHRPSLFYWHVTSPDNQTMWFRNNTWIVYDPDLSQATIKKIPSENDPSLIFLKLLTGDAHHALESFTVDVKDEKFFLKPKSMDKDALLMGVVLELTSDGAIREIQYKTTLGQRTRVTFDHVQVNKRLSRDQEALFSPSFPKGTDFVNAE